MAYLFVFCFGLIVGSFLNVVIYRYNTGQGIIGGRSRCPACAAGLRWFELLPLASFLWQSGRCRRCLSKISWQYPAVEVATGLIFALTVWKFNLSALSRSLLPLVLGMFSLLIVITVYDLRHKIIPDGLVYAFIILAALLTLLSGDLILWREHLLTGLGLFAFFFLLWWLSDGHWIGFGDGKLALGVGFWLGYQGGISAVVLAFWLGAAIGVLLVLFSQLSRLSRPLRSFTMKSEIPFAPFIIAGLLLNFFLNLNVFTLFQIL